MILKKVALPLRLDGAVRAALACLLIEGEADSDVALR
jgi:hypothetical protein